MLTPPPKYNFGAAPPQKKLAHDFFNAHKKLNIFNQEN